MLKDKLGESYCLRLLLMEIDSNSVHLKSRTYSQHRKGSQKPQIELSLMI